MEEKNAEKQKHIFLVSKDEIIQSVNIFSIDIVKIRAMTQLSNC